MKPINFISPLPPEKKRELRIWLYVSGGLLVGAITTIALLTFSQWHAYTTLKRQQAQLIANEHEIQKTLQEHKQREDSFLADSQKLSKMRGYVSHPKNPYGIIKKCVDTVGKAALERCDITKPKIEIAFKSSSASAGQKLLAQLKTIPEIENLSLVSLQKQGTEYLHTVRGALRRPAQMCSV